MSFPITEPPRLSRATVRRDEQLRLDTAWQASTWPKARVLVVDEKGRSPVEPGGSTGSVVLTKAGPEVSADLPSEAVLIGVDARSAGASLGEQDDVPYWAVRGQPSLLDGDDPSQWQDLRMCGAALDATSAGLMVSAVAVLNWHDNAGFCARCGARTEVRQAGWVRECTGCGREEYPRTDPAIICLVHDGGTGGSARVLLARQPVWPPGRFSVLAGFVEAGESLEACVAREIQEEVGVTVTDIRYLASQAWPFPRSIMIGFEAVADPSQPLRPADGEIAEAFWLTRDELRRALVDAADATRDWATEPGDGRLLVPPSISIARTMLDSWSTAQD